LLSVAGDEEGVRESGFLKSEAHKKDFVRIILGKEN